MTAKMNEGRILDRDFEENINSRISEAHSQINSNMADAHKYMQRQQAGIEDAVREGQRDRENFGRDLGRLIRR